MKKYNQLIIIGYKLGKRKCNKTVSCRHNPISEISVNRYAYTKTDRMHRSKFHQARTFKSEMSVSLKPNYRQREENGGGSVTP